jgi:peptidoglycan/LPS O-acetylase OafA/YrhL
MNYNQKHTKDYRSEIDGLRAIAVLPVIFFHAGYKFFSGGYIGVDVFFVISGYLISTVIIDSLNAGTFSIKTFYERRAKRILPLLLFVTLICIPLAWLYLPASEYNTFSKSLVASTLFGSNLFFWQSSGYFNTTAYLQPLLHTWSLSVEEQFYIVYPIFLILSWKLGKKRIISVIGIMFLGSFTLALWAVHSHPVLAYYVLPTRLWELLLGAIIAFYLSWNRLEKLNSKLKEIGGWLGLALICFSILCFNEVTPYPSQYTLIPTMGASLVIIFARQDTKIGRFLANWFLVRIGLISYSAYLWHQPVFAFARHQKLSEPSPLAFFGLILLTILLSVLSWKYIENYFRSSLSFRGRQLFILSTILSAFLIFVGMVGIVNKGFPMVKSKTDIAIKDVLNQNFIVIGDSHAEHLIKGLDSLTTGKVENLTSGGCIPFRNVDRYDSRFAAGGCVEIMNNNLDRVLKLDPQAFILLSSLGPVYLDGTAFKEQDLGRITGLEVVLITNKSLKDRYQIFEIGMRNTLEELSSLSNSKVIFALDVPELGINQGCNVGTKQFVIGQVKVRDLISKLSPSSCFVSRKDYDARVFKYKKLVKNVMSDFPNVIFFDPTSLFCTRSICKGYDPDFGYLYKDFDHLSDSGSQYYAESLARLLN